MGDLKDIDLKTKEGALAFYAWTQKLVTEAMPDLGCVLPQGFVLARLNPETGAELAKVGVVHVLHEGEFDAEGKEKFVNNIRLLAKSCRAIGVIVFSEAWTVRAEETKSEKEIKELLERARRKGLSNHPDKQEVVMSNLEHEFVSAFAMAPITEEEAGGETVRKVGTFELKVGEKLEGRFSQYLPQWS